jgi:hypothetical protein
MRPLLSFSLFVLCFGCAQGGQTNTPQSAVKIAATHHLFGLRALGGFSAFPVPPEEVFPDHGLLTLANDSTYTVTRTSGTSPSDQYALANDGTLNIYSTGTGRVPTVIFPGAYGLMGDRADFWFCDLSSTSASPSLGMFFGTRVTPGTADLAGQWTLCSLHILFPSSSLISPNNVARAANALLTVDPDPANDPGTLRVVNGTGTDSAGTPLDFLGSTIQYLVVNGTGDGTVNMTLNYRDSRQPVNTADARVFQTALGKDILFAAQTDESSGEAGLAVLMRTFPNPGPAADPALLAGTFLAGGLTFFVNPTAAGTDGCIGTLTLTAARAFTLDMVGHQNIEFTYTGTYALDPTGRITFTVSGTNETWHGAVTRDYNAVMILDDFVETRANNTPELNLFLGLRQNPTSS